MKSKIVGLIVLLMIFVCVISLVKVNKWIQGEVSEISQTTVPMADVVSEPAPAQKKSNPKKRTGDVIRKTRLAPERTFEISVFYQGGEEIARHKVSKKGMVFDQTGDIPNGKVKFINETSQTYGVEYYRDNRKHGLSRTNYKAGQLKAEANYFYGKLMSRKKFYIDGVLKMEEDYSNARQFMDDRLTGAGKEYWRDGTVKFEWKLIDSEPVGYHKTYNTKGVLRVSVYFDEFGNEKPALKNVTVKSAAPTTALNPL